MQQLLLKVTINYLKNYAQFFKMESKMFDLYFKEDIGGEKILVFNTDIRRNYKHELVKEEKFITEARMYHKMDENHKILCVNEVIEIGDYKEDGYTKNIIQFCKKIKVIQKILAIYC